MGPIQAFDELFDMIRRRFWLIAIVFVSGAVMACMYARSLPHQFASSEVIQIEQPRIAVGLAPSTIDGSAARRLQLIEQQLMARDSVLEIIENFDIYADLPALTDGEKVVMFRRSVAIDGIAAARETGFDDGTIAALTITATMSMPHKARDVAQELSRRTIALSGEARRAKTQATLDFFLSEENDVASVIAQIEDEIAVLRRNNSGLATGRAEALQAEISAVNSAIVEVESNKIGLERELDQVDRTSTRPATLRRIDGLNQQINTFEEQLVFLRSRRDGLEQQARNTPQAESEMAVLERRLVQNQTQLSAISARRTEAEIGHRLEESRQAERLTVLEPANLPDYPVGPGRKKYAIVGIIASLMAGIALAYLLEILNPVIRSGKQLQRELGITPAVSIPLQRVEKRPRRSLRTPIKALFAKASGVLPKTKFGQPKRKIKVAV